MSGNFLSRSPIDRQASWRLFWVHALRSPYLVALLLAGLARPLAAQETPEQVSLTLLEVERTHTLTIPTQGRARALILRPETLQIVSASDSEIVFQGVSLGSTLVHLWDQTGRRDFRVDVTELRSVLSEIEQRKKEALQQRLGVPQRSLKFQYRATHQNLERSPEASFDDLREENRIRAHQLRANMGVPWGDLVGDLYLEQRRDDILGKEVTQPRNLTLQLQRTALGPLGKADWVLGDKDLFFSNLTVNGRRYRGFALFPSEDPAGQREERLYLSLFTGEEREGLFLDFPAGSQTRQARSRFAGTKLEYEWLEGFKTHLTGLHRFGKGGQFRADHVAELGFDWNWEDLLVLEAIAARNGTESGYELQADLRPLAGVTFDNEFWRIGKRYKTVTGSVNRDGQTGWKGILTVTLPFWNEAIRFRPEATIYRDLNALNPNNLDEWNTFYSLGTTVQLPWRTHLQASASTEDQSGSPLPFVAQRYDATLSREITFRENPWLQELLYGKELIRGFTPFMGFRYADFGKSNNVPGFDATLKLLRLGTRLSFPKGIWGEVSWSQGQLKESNPETAPGTIQPKEVVLEAGASHRFDSPPVNLDMNLRYVDVEETFRKTHQPFVDRNRLSGTLRFAWRMARDRELFGTVTATRQKPETAREDTLLDLFAQIGFRTTWDTPWAFTRRGKISGSFFKDLNFNGVRDVNEPGLPGARVRVVDGPSTATDQDGRFLLRLIPEGLRTVKIEMDQLPQGYLFTTPNSVELLVLAHQEAEVLFGISTQVEFRGRVYNDLNENRIFDEGIDVPLQGIVLSLETGQSASTDADGIYRLGKVSPGAHTLSVVITSVPDGYQSEVPIRREFQTREGEVVTFDLPLKALRSLLGSVFLPGKKGVEGLRLRMDSPREAFTDEKGNYRFDDLAPGPAQVQLDPKGLPAGFRLRSTEPIRLVVPKGPFLQRLDFELVPLDWRPEGSIPAEEFKPAPPSEAAGRERQERVRLLRSRIQAQLQDLAPQPFSAQIIDAGLAEQFPELSVLAELHPGIHIDRGQMLDDVLDLVTDLIAQSVTQAHYYGPPERAERFRKAAQGALIEVKASETVRLQVLLREILVNLSGRTEQEVADQVDLIRLDTWLAQIAAEERKK